LRKVVIVGAGITGITTAYWLRKSGLDVTIIEKESFVGGNIQTLNNNGTLFDSGPNSGLETTPLINQLVDELNLKDEFCYADPSADKRYILRDEVLHPLPMNPLSFIKTDLFSSKAKMRLMCEPFFGKSKDGYYQSVAQFVRRRLGKEFLDYAINPFVSGVFAGDPEQLSVKSAFPKLYRLEEVYGGLIKGMIKGAKERKKRGEKSKLNASMFSFKNGMKVLPETLHQYLQKSVVLNESVHSVNSENGKWKVETLFENNLKTYLTDALLFTIPAYEVSKLLKPLDGRLSNHLNSIYYPPVIVLNLIFKKKGIGQELDGFGFLIPEKERKSFLGAIWNSVIFPNRSNNDEASFTLFIGGAREPKLLESNLEKLLDEVIVEFQSIMKINQKPLALKYKIWEKAIPQYNIGYIEHEKYFERFEKLFPGLFLGGNYRGGISVGDCIINSEKLSNKILTFLNV
jgi:oxygen-dependent protoporphyrinogen oxidase